MLNRMATCRSTDKKPCGNKLKSVEAACKLVTSKEGSNMSEAFNAINSASEAIDRATARVNAISTPVLELNALGKLNLPL